MLVALVVLAVLALAASTLLFWSGGTVPAAPVHLALAVGAMPLIMGAMMHFVPVLTRSMAPTRAVRTLPLLMLAAGLLAFLSFVLPVGSAVARDLATTLGIAGAVSMAWWIRWRGVNTLGRPHPCLHWYLGAVVCLLLALFAVLAMRIWPEQYLPLRRFHLHLNTLGFIGMTAIGTLQVLLPTAAGRPDSRAAQRLRTDLKWALAGTLLIATGAAWQKFFVWPGLILWMIPILRLAAAWLALYRREILHWSGAIPSLSAALLGFAAVLLLGAGHGLGYLPTSGTTWAYVLAFLFPLITGAASQLLPVWLRSGPQTAWHTTARQWLGRLSAVRALLFIAGGVALGLGLPWGLFLAALGLALFVFQLLTLRLRAAAFQAHIG